MAFWDPLESIGMGVFHVGTLGIFKVIDNHDRSDNADEQRRALDDQGKQAWEGDRTIIGDEWARLRAGADVTMQEAAVKDPEPFSAWPHQQIWEALQGKDGQGGVDAGQINATADGWRRLTTGTETAVDNYRTDFERVLTEKWSGASGSAAIEAVKSYTTEAAKLPTTFQMVANGIDYMEGLLGQAKIAIPKPEEVSAFDEFVGHIPGNGVVKAAQHRANEAEADARLFMIGTYQPGALTVDQQTPVLPLPQNNVTDPGGGVPGDGSTGDANGGGNNTDNGGGASTNPAGTPENPTAETPQSATPGDDQADDDTDDDSTSPASTESPATTPATTPTTTPAAPGDSKLGSPGAGSPGSGSPGSGSPGSGVPGGAGVPAAGRSVAGTPGAAGAQNSGARAAASAAGARGMSGMPGMMGGGGRGGGRDDENEHTTPDYLVHDREHELIGQLPPTLPPGGVIGA
ncbi:hypothetical protein AB0I35_09115 [Nocardia sp. NPDC050378]|uniref:PPE domain-containing protein n=1 Tax=Nocardia sp. NPDC050378 TaxID=3155400 RepID=UPI003401BCD8